MLTLKTEIAELNQIALRAESKKEELNRQLTALQEDYKRLEADRDNLASERDDLRRQLSEIPQSEGGSVPVEQIKIAIAHYRSRSGPDTARGKMLHELADSIEAVLAGEPFEAKEKKGGRKPKYGVETG